jgi:hypothetical protein
MALTKPNSCNSTALRSKARRCATALLPKTLPTAGLDFHSACRQEWIKA